jgi:hypothetical protein
MFKIILGWIVMIGSVVSGLYVGGWLMFIQPILEVCRAFDAGTLTGLIFGIAVIKCIFASTVGAVIIYVGAAIANALFDA